MASRVLTAAEARPAARRRSPSVTSTSMQEASSRSASSCISGAGFASAVRSRHLDERDATCREHRPTLQVPLQRRALGLVDDKLHECRGVDRRLASATRPGGPRTVRFSPARGREPKPHLNYTQLGQSSRRYVEASGVGERKRVTPHALRHVFASDASARGRQPAPDPGTARAQAPLT